MREIKFRFWDLEGKQMYGSTLFDLCYTTQFSENYGNDFDRYEIMEYVGIKDVNDKEIYEGDIVRHGDLTATVEFEGGAFRAVYKNDKTDTYNLLTTACEIIGNIYKGVGTEDE